jgi:hypothetical protein
MPLTRVCSLVVMLVGGAAVADSGAPEALQLKPGDLGVVQLVEANEQRVVLEVLFPRAWRPADVARGKKLRVKAELTLADGDGVFYRGPAPAFVVTADCENDGGTWVEPIARLELKVSSLKRPLRAPIGAEKVVGLATLGKGTRPKLKADADARTLLRVDFDGDGAADAELRTEPADAGCGPRLDEDDLRIRTTTASVPARCCGP